MRLSISFSQGGKRPQVHEEAQKAIVSCDSELASEGKCRKKNLASEPGVTPESQVDLNDWLSD